MRIFLFNFHVPEQVFLCNAFRLSLEYNQGIEFLSFSANLALSTRIMKSKTSQDPVNFLYPTYSFMEIPYYTGYVCCLASLKVSYLLPNFYLSNGIF